MFITDLAKASIYLPAVGKVTILMLLRNLYVPGSHSKNEDRITHALETRLRLQQYQCVVREGRESN
jgi:hypothetical protein